jgi:hypothetical protein
MFDAHNTLQRTLGGQAAGVKAGSMRITPPDMATDISVASVLSIQPDRSSEVTHCNSPATMPPRSACNLTAFRA